MIPARLLATIALFTLARAASPGVIVVDDSGTADFTTVQAAVDAATDGDLIVLKPGLYSTADITDKSLTIVSDPGVDPASCALSRVRIAQLSASRTVVLSRLTISSGNYGPAAEDGCAVLVRQCAGAVRIQRCNLNGSWHGQNADGYPAAIVRQSGNVQFMSTSAEGGNGRNVNCGVGLQVGAGGTGLLLETSTVFVHGGQWRGGQGGFGCTQGGSGGAAIHVVSGTVTLTGSDAIGGFGGDAKDIVQPAAAIGGSGGTGIIGDAGITVTLVGTQAIGGTPGENKLGQPGPIGATIAGGANFVLPAWPTRMVAITPVAKEGAPVNLLVEGAQGEVAWLFVSASAGVFVAGPQGGAYALGAPLGPWPLGVLNANGQLVVPVTAPNLPPGLLGATVHLQAALSGPLGAGFTDPAHVTLLHGSL